jgi:hypothetical protein
MSDEQPAAEEKKTPNVSLKRKRESFEVEWIASVGRWRAFSQDSLRLFLGFFASESEAKKTVKNYSSSTEYIYC